MKESDFKSLSKDLKFGLTVQTNSSVIENLNKQLNCELKEIKYKYARMDYLDDDKKIYVELKSRRSAYNEYPNTLIQKSKIDYAIKRIKEGYKCYLLFVFQYNNHYYIEINEDKFKTYECKKFKRGFRIDYSDQEKDYYFIPTDDLTDITPCLF
jgi:DNA-binding sugar fermentation-stimulating protein